MIAPHFAQFLEQLHQPPHDDFATLVRALSKAIDDGSSCLELKDAPDHSAQEWREILAPDAEGSATASPGGHAPLILSTENRLYLQRYHLHERQVFEAINERSRATTETLSADMLARIAELFEGIEGNDQATAARRALERRFTIISGGPGTGKTTTVLKILLLLKEAGHIANADDCLLLAPTGKAADRLRQSIVDGLAKLGIDDDEFPTETSTIHRALGYRHGSIEFAHDAANPLNARVVVIDETSMVDLPLMSRLLGALRPCARAILLGDKHQLTSVQIGTVLADLMDVADHTAHPLADCAVTLRKSYRTRGPIHDACESIRDGDGDTAWQAVSESAWQAVNKSAWQVVSESATATAGAIIHHPLPDDPRAAIEAFVTQHWLPPLTDDSLTARQKLDAVDRFHILTPTHMGRFGVEAINRTVDQILDAHGVPTAATWYPGRSVIVRKNDYGLKIYNGDTALALRSEDGEIDICFRAPEGHRAIRPARLPEVDTAWALTIHRTQGSEYDHVLLIIPPSENSKILSRELLYTGLSRARNSVTLWCDEESFRATVATTVSRASGLAAMFAQQ